MLYRVGSLDKWIADNLIEYNLEEYLKRDDVVIDIGSHAGYFANKCLEMGAGYVYCFEMDRGNFEMGLSNLSHWGSRAKSFHKAVWRSDIPDTSVSYGAYPNWNGLSNTGGLGAVLSGGANTCDSISLDTIIDTVLLECGRVDLIKIDAESAEWPILLTSELLYRARTIIGEYHEIGGMYDQHNPAIVDLGYSVYDVLLLKRHLEMLGYKFKSNRYTNLNIGHFWAKRI